MVEPTPTDGLAADAAWVGPVGGATRSIRMRRVPVAAGMMRGRFSGFEKKAKTRSKGNGTHCSNWNLPDIGVKGSAVEAGRGQLLSFREI